MTGNNDIALRSRPIAARPAITDSQVMAQIKSGSIAAFEVLYDRYCTRVYRVARSVCRDDGRAQEALQETFVSLWRTRASYEERGNLAPWVLAVARHRAIDIARRNQPHAAMRARDSSLDTVAGLDCVADTVANSADSNELLSCLASLPEMQREAITLAFYGELTHVEIAGLLDLPIGTVKGRIRLGMAKMRADIQRRETGEPDRTGDAC